MISTPISQEKAEEFVRLWQASPTATAVARKLNMSRQRVHQIAEKLVAIGVPLKKKKESPEIFPHLDVEKLKRIVQGEE